MGCISLSVQEEGVLLRLIWKKTQPSVAVTPFKSSHDPRSNVSKSFSQSGYCLYVVLSSKTQVCRSYYLKIQKNILLHSNRQKDEKAAPCRFLAHSFIDTCSCALGKALFVISKHHRLLSVTGHASEEKKQQQEKCFFYQLNNLGFPKNINAEC